MSLAANKDALVTAVTDALTNTSSPEDAAAAIADAIEAYVAEIVIACVDGESVQPTP